MIRLLIADDHAIVRSGLRQLAGTLHGVELVAEAANGEEAVALCETHKPDVVLMDVQMPVLDGIGAARRITDADPRVAVVVLTSFSVRGRILAALDAGAAGYVVKDAERFGVRLRHELVDQFDQLLCPEHLVGVYAAVNPDDRLAFLRERTRL